MLLKSIFCTGITFLASRGRLLLLVFLLGIPLQAEISSQKGTIREEAVTQYYSSWKKKYLIPSVRFPGDYKIDFDGKGTTVSEAMGYGMLITAFMADSDPNAKGYFDGLNRFRKRFPSSMNPAFMCWKIPPKEHPGKDDCATDGELDMAFALLLAHQQWGDSGYLEEAKNLIRNIGTSLVRPDFSLRLGDWNLEPGQTRTSDFMPTHFRAFQEATGDPLWGKVEKCCYDILEELQNGSAPATGLVPDFALKKKGNWVPAQTGFLESRYDGDYYYNACRVPWRIGWASLVTCDERAERFLKRFVHWLTLTVPVPKSFAAGYQLDGKSVRDSDFETACFISPTGVAAMAVGNRLWEEEVFKYATKSREEYYEDTVNLLCMMVMSGKARMPSPTGQTFPSEKPKK